MMLETAAVQVVAFEMTRRIVVYMLQIPVVVT